MEVKDRVEKIKNFFITLNVSDGAICVVVKFPKKWTMPDNEALASKFKCQLAQQNDCQFFMTELENGFDTVFNTIDFIIDSNRAMEEKAALLEIKAKELTDLFVTEPLERLKTLYFGFSEQNTKRKNKKKTSSDIQDVDSEQVIEEIKESQPEEIIDQTEDDGMSSLMEAALKMTEE